MSVLSDPLLTIAMPVFNGGVHLRIAVLSVVQQSFTDWELLLIDDGSTDGEVNKIADLDDPRIRILRDGQNCGLAARLNEAIGLARGRYFARMDADDIAHPERFARQLAMLQTDPSIDLIGSQCVAISEKSDILGALPFAESHQEICARPWIGFYLPHPTWVGKLEWFQRFRYADPAPYCCEDQELLLRSHALSHFHALPAILLAYRLRDHLNWRKVWRTRGTLYRIQLKHFIGSESYTLAGLSTVAVVLRLGRDSLKLLMQFALGSVASRYTDSSISKEELESWQSWIRRLESQQGVV